MKNVLLFGFFLFACSHLIAQVNPFEEHAQSIGIFVDGLNQQDYRRMQKPLGFIGKAIITKGMLKKEFEPFHQKYGPATIDTIVFSSVYNGNAVLTFDQFPEKKSYLTFNFSENGKVQGFGFGYPILLYKKRNSPALSPLSADEKVLRIDSLFKRRSNAQSPRQFNGCILVTDHDEVIYKNCSGYSNFDQEIPLNDSTLFLLASCTKQFTAVAIMMLLEAGKLNYSDRVQTHLPGFPYAEITLEHLLTHTSGLPEYFPLLEKYADKTRFATNQDILDLLVTHHPDLFFTPGVRFDYCNTGYTLLSLLIEKVSGMSYSDFLTQQIFEPLKMNHTLVYNRRKEKDALGNYAPGYVYSKVNEKFMLPDSLPNYQYVTYMDGITGDDGVSSSILDLKKWNDALANHTLVSAQAMEQAFTKQQLANGKETDYGFGFFLRSGAGIERVVYHTGGWPGYSTMIMRFPEKGKSIIILSNNDYDHFTFLADELAEVLLRD